MFNSTRIWSCCFINFLNWVFSIHLVLLDHRFIFETISWTCWKTEILKPCSCIILSLSLHIHTYFNIFFSYFYVEEDSLIFLTKPSLLNSILWWFLHEFRICRLSNLNFLKSLLLSCFVETYTQDAYLIAFAYHF